VLRQAACSKLRACPAHHAQRQTPANHFASCHADWSALLTTINTATDELRAVFGRHCRLWPHNMTGMQLQQLVAACSTQPVGKHSVCDVTHLEPVSIEYQADALREKVVITCSVFFSDHVHVTLQGVVQLGHASHNIVHTALYTLPLYTLTALGSRGEVHSGCLLNV
jgi:hypothetical protein